MNLMMGKGIPNNIKNMKSIKRISMGTLNGTNFTAANFQEDEENKEKDKNDNDNEYFTGNISPIVKKGIIGKFS